MTTVKDAPSKKEVLRIGTAYKVKEKGVVRTGMLLRAIEKEDSLLFILTDGNKYKCIVNESIEFEPTILPSYIHDKMENILFAYRRLEIAEVIKARKERAIIDEQREILSSQNELMAMSEAIH